MTARLAGRAPGFAGRIRSRSPIIAISLMAGDAASYPVTKTAVKRMTEVFAVGRVPRGRAKDASVSR